MISRIYIFLLFFTSLFCASAQEVNIIPRPYSLTVSTSKTFVLDATIEVVYVKGKAILAEINYFIEQYAAITGMRPAVTTTDMVFESSMANGKHIVFDLNQMHLPDTAGAYRLKITDNEIKISAGDNAGIFYGFQSLLQLVHHAKDNKIPQLLIKDFPRFDWRGMHLDVCRHFFPVSFVKKYIDLLARHKMNVFHWHLTDDQGWRIEIKKYPKLTEVGAWRNGSMVGPYTDHRVDSVRYGGFYTQEEIREVVKYAAERHITVVPEIEMPGHALAALAAYPELSCTGGPFEVEKTWGVFDDVFCAGNEKTFAFMQDVMDEVCDLFPGKYIHVGGDECPKTRWEKCVKCQQRIHDEKLKNEHELQSYFIQRVEKYLNQKGKLIIGWDEILEGGLAPNAAVMSWRGNEGGTAAAQQKHKAVMSPGSHCYFDHYQGDPRFEPLAFGGYTPIQKVYAYEPVPKELGAEEAQYIMGAQANVWTEYILSTDHVEYMALPRMCALAEVLWTPTQLRNEKDFMQRLGKHFTYLDRLGVNYSATVFMPEIKIVSTKNGIGVSVRPSPLASSTNVYTDDEKSKTFAVLVSDEDQLPGMSVFSIQRSCRFCVSPETSKSRPQEACLDISVNPATGKAVSFSKAPHEKYSAGAELLLVDGLKGNRGHRNGGWVAWSGTDVEITIDLGKKQKIKLVKIFALDENNNWIYLPSPASAFASKNNSDFKLLGEMKVLEKQSGRYGLVWHGKKIKTRYIKLVLKNPGEIPEGQPGAGKDSWMFFDEIIID